MTPQDKMRLLMSRANAPEDMWEPAVRIIDEALLAERRRAIEACAQVAELARLDATHIEHVARNPACEILLASQIAKAIRSLSPSSPRGDNR